MKLDIINIDKFVEVNRCPEVTNPIFFNFDTTPTKDGLFSYELFGITDEDRKNIFGYINLNFHAIHPVVFNLLNSRFGSYKYLLDGTKYAVIENNKVKFVDEDYPGAGTGSDFLYENFEKIDWLNAVEEDEMESLDKKTRLKFLKSLKKEEVFITKWLVLPPFYRAENSTSKTMGDQINKLYKELILRCKSLKSGFSFNLFNTQTKIRIQNLLKDIYFSTLTPVSGKNFILDKGSTTGRLVGTAKNSMVRKHLIGKNVDWGASCVITSPQNSMATKFRNKPVKFGYTCVPLATLISLFEPFFIHGMNGMLQDAIETFYLDNRDRIKKIDRSQFSATELEKLLKKFIKTPSRRFDLITFSYINSDGEKKEAKWKIFEYKNEESFKKGEPPTVERFVTLTDLLYWVAEEELSDKHIYATRYPIADVQNIFPAKVSILTTTRTRKNVFISSVRSSQAGLSVLPSGFVTQTFEEYPLIPYEGSGISPSSVNFFDVMICGNAYLASMGGDYDGDMFYLKSVFSKEANEEVERLIYSKVNVLGSRGTVSRSINGIGKDCVISLYEFTKDPIK